MFGNFLFKYNINIKTLFQLNILVIAICVLTGCKDKDKDDDTGIKETDRVSALLTSSGPWTVQSVTVDGSDQTALYKDVQLTFTSTSFTTTNGGVIWPASGTWKFTDDTAHSIERDDKLVITLDEVADKRKRKHLTVVAIDRALPSAGPGKGVLKV